jgi:hypothetical protein
MVYVMV